MKTMTNMVGKWKSRGKSTSGETLLQKVVKSISKNLAMGEIAGTPTSLESCGKTIVSSKCSRSDKTTESEKINFRNFMEYAVRENTAILQKQ